jgi:hypothetical protein
VILVALYTAGMEVDSLSSFCRVTGVVVSSLIHFVLIIQWPRWLIHP